MWKIFQRKLPRLFYFSKLFSIHNDDVQIYKIINFYFAGTKDKKGTPGERGNPGYFAMKFVNLRNRNRQPTVLVIKHPYVQFKIDSMTCDLKKGVLKVDSNETEVVQHITLAFVTATLYLLVQPRPPVLVGSLGNWHSDKPWEKKGPKAVIIIIIIFCTYYPFF